MLDMQQETGVIWYATGISTTPDTITQEATRVQGIHNEHVLIILDEAAGIMPEIWRAIEHIGAPFKRVLAIGNPTSKFGDFSSAIKDPTWNRVNISVKDTPNFKEDQQIIPGVYGREYEQRIRLKYGVDSDDYRVRVEGGISEKGAEGSYYGRKMAELDRKGRISDLFEHNPNYPVHIIQDVGYTTAIGFLQVIEGWSTFINYYEDSGLGIENYVDLFDEYRKQFGYRYGKVIVPCDMDSNATRIITGQTALDTLKKFDFIVKALPREHRVNEGIERTRKYLDTCRFHKTRCARLLDCLEGYHERKNKQMSTEDEPVFTGIPEKDGTDHACLTADTLIRTTKGQIPIQDIKTGDYVVTPAGRRKVLAAGLSKYATQLLEIITNKGKKLVCTPEHKIFFDNSIERADTVGYNSLLFDYGFLRNILWSILLKLSLTGSGIGFRKAITNGLGRKPYTRPFGSTITALCQRVIEYITKTTTHLIMTLQTLNCSQKENTRFCTANVSAGMVAKPMSSNWQRQEEKPIQSTSRNVWFAEQNTRQLTRAEQNTARTFVSPEGIGQSGFMVKNAIVLFVRSLLQRINIRKSERVVRIVRQNWHRSPRPVYDLTIEKDHCYYANDLLVSNCDMVRYASKAVQELDLSGGVMTAEESEEIWAKHRRPYG